MWLVFLLGVVLLTLVLWTPGYLLLRGAGMCRLQALSFAPAVGLTSYGVLGTLYAFGSLSTSWLGLVAPVTAASLFYYVVQRFCKHGNARDTRPIIGKHIEHNRTELPRSGSASNAMVLALYIVVALALTGWVFVKTLDGPASFGQFYDNYHHPLMVRQFIEDGLFSASNPFSDYPPLFFTPAALVGSMLQCEPTMALNIALVVFLGMLLPCGMFAFLSAILGPKTPGPAGSGSRLALICGAFTAPACAAFPWRLLVGALYPYLAGLVMALFAMAALVLLFSRLTTHKPRWILCTLWLSLGTAMAHPSAIFVCVILMVPFLISRLLRLTFPKHWSLRPPVARLLHVAICVGFAVVVCAGWIALNQSKAFAGVVGFPYWSAYGDVSQFFANLVTMGLNRLEAPQWIFAFMVFCGMVYCISTRTVRWTIGSFIFTLPFYYFSVCGDGSLRSLFIGFWYNDSYRIDPIVAIAAVPLASLGLSAIVQAVWRVFLNPENDTKTRQQRVLAIATVVAFSAINYLPSYQQGSEDSLQQQVTAFGAIRTMLAQANTLADTQSGLTGEELQFLNEVKSITKDDVVVNIPFDGSGFADGVSGVNVLYKRWDLRKDEVSSIQSGLKDIAFDTNVQRDVRSANAKYVLLLDQGTLSGENVYLPETMEDLDWTGLTELHDQTPGLSLVLSEGDMRLYRIDCA
ncbi:hypothetical protein QJ043_08735 [Olsenella sp. YH-ols2217]|uniref:Uncharacterized protein n=1 Tax=Kribbibacterium absianum TaxID=3044210 RepID=A0ABT6ZM75_9ACTN|nr:MULTISPECIES: DUF6541 family protein [unclassified Olsenella]MDJ1122150.1 hypothetical protein [Olsenella sp. YH-ols2216]MDJ1130158.1 hypothetical protein [Olsenella sp. YH-ols2217]